MTIFRETIQFNRPYIPQGLNFGEKQSSVTPVQLWLP